MIQRYADGVTSLIGLRVIKLQSIAKIQTRQ